MASDGGYVCAAAALAVQASGRSAARQLLVEVFAEALAHQVEGEGVHAGVGEGQHAGADAGDEVAQRGVHLAVVVGAVQVDHVTRQPADGKQTHKDQHGFGQTLSGLDLTAEKREERDGLLPFNRHSWTFVVLFHQQISLLCQQNASFYNNGNV